MIYISVVIPVYNEEENLPALIKRLINTMRKIKKPFEIIFVNDCSRDKSIQILEEIYKKNPKQIRVVDLKRNCGQYTAILAGLEQSSGKITITLDADLQNPPEEIPKLIALMEKGYDLVSGYRVGRQDIWYRRFFSKLINLIRDKFTNIHMKDMGCMLRAHSREVVDSMLEAKGSAIFVPALAYSCAFNPIDVPVQHEARFAGESKYNFFDLVQITFDLMTDYSMAPLYVFSILGFGISILSLLFAIYLVIRRIFLGPEVQGVFTLFAIMFFFAGILLMGLGVIGEYIRRIYQEMRRQRPSFAIKRILGKQYKSKK